MILASRVRLHYGRFLSADSEARIFLVRNRYIPGFLSFLLLPFRLLLAVILRAALLALRPIVHIRFGPMYSHSLGVWAFPTELYLCEKDAGLLPHRSFDFFYYFDNARYLRINPPKEKDQACNGQLDVMFKRHLRISQVAGTLDKLNRTLRMGSGTFSIPVGNLLDATGILERFPPHLTFTEEEEQRGISGLRDLGIEPGSKFVCFHARDGAYIFRDAPRARMVSLYGDWEIQDYRNSTIEHYLSAVDELANRGYYAVRMGKFVKDSLDHENPRVIDYASKYHSDFMDVYLSARCAFFIGQNSGMTHLPSIFRTPMAFVNVIYFADIVLTGCPNSIFIPKKYYSNKQRRLLTFREIMSDRRLSHYPLKPFEHHTDFYEGLGLEIQENTPQEIEDLALEMDERLRGNFNPSQEDKELQSRFHETITSYPEAFPPFDDLTRLRIGSGFLRNHPELLAR